MIPAMKNHPLSMPLAAVRMRCSRAYLASYCSKASVDPSSASDGATRSQGPVHGQPCRTWLSRRPRSSPPGFLEGWREAPGQLRHQIQLDRHGITSNQDLSMVSIPTKVYIPTKAFIGDDHVWLLALGTINIICSH